MASRKKVPPPAQPSFAFPSLTAPPVAAPEIRVEVAEAPSPVAPPLLLRDLHPEEPHTSPVVAERKLRIVPKPEEPQVPEEDVSIEPLNDGRFVVALVRHYGGSVAAVIYTRTQLEMFLRRIPAALEVG